ncbi:MAG TPA: GNAT family N-acetyltransferase, partial [Dokdonella sp.]
MNPTPPATPDERTGAPARSDDAPSWTDMLHDGTRVSIRPIRADDAALEKAFIEHLSPESRRLRFLGSIGEPSAALIRSLT